MRVGAADKPRGMWRRVAVVTAVVTVVLAGTAYGAFVGLPASGTQVNNDPPSIDPGQSAGLTDLTSGSLIAGNPRVPWATFSQASAGGSQQIFVRAFKGGSWQTEGFPASLNEDATKVAQAPSIDFTGSNRTVPWVTWAEPSAPLASVSQIFASRFLSQPAPAQNGGLWVHEGQQVTGTAPSLNINTNRDAADPSLIGGTTNAGANPAPWVTWQEFDGKTGTCPTPGTVSCAPQIFVSHAVPATANACPAGTKPAHGASVGNFCFQQVGIDRVQGPAAGQLDPSLNIDPSRSGIETDIAFTGPGDTVPWVVWYENSDSNGGHPSTHGLFNADMVFASRAVADASGDGGFHWQVVGLGTAGKTASQDVLNTGGANGIGDCGTSLTSEQACSLDVASATGLNAGSGAENPQVTAGTMVPGKNTTPWIAWDESSANGGLHSVFVARLDAAGDHFDLLNNGQPISHAGLESTRPDIVFSHNTPYVSWHENNGTTTQTFVGHFEGNPANPVFHIDTTSGIPTTTAVTSDDDLTDVRSPVASTCPADPFTSDGAGCQGNNIGTPFFAYTDDPNGGPRMLFAKGYTPGTVTTGTASSVTQTTAMISGTVNTDGAHALAHFDYGTSSAYGSSTPGQLMAPAAGTSTPVVAALAGLPAGTVIHYRVVAQTDFGTANGADATFKTIALPVVGRPSISHVSLSGIARREAKLKFSLNSGANAPAIRRIRISLPKGLGFSKHRRKLIKGISVKNASGRRLKFSAKRDHGLQITLRSPATKVKVTIGPPAITVTRHLARAVKHKKVKRLKLVVKVTDTSNKTTTFRPRPRVH
jgi:hypothetical protein